MYDKENDYQTKTTKRASKAKTIESGNDYVLKRYRLQENRHFKDRNADELGYDDPSQKKDVGKAEEELQQDLILIPLELPSQLPQQHQESINQQNNPNFADMVYVFDDEEVEVKEENNKKEVSIVEEKEQITLESKRNYFNDLTSKGSERGNVSTAELMSPKMKKNNNLFKAANLKKELDQPQPRSFQKKQTIHFEHKRQISSTGLDSLKGVEIEQKKQQNGVTIKIVDKKVFSLCKLPSGIVLRCKIKRTSSFLNMVSPQYDLYLANGLKHIVSAKKYPMRNRQLFKFSTDPLKFEDSNILAIMHANANHNIYWLLDLPKRINELDVSLLHLIIGYYRLKKGTQRKFSVLLPQAQGQFHLAIDYEQSLVNFSHFKEEINMHLNNLQQWEEQNRNSTKNFVLADEDDPDYRYLQMTKESDNMFELIVQHPLSPLQAMAIAMTRFDAQLA